MFRWVCAAFATALAILLPAVTHAATESDARGSEIYVVQQGDTLLDISRRTGVEVRVLITLNRLPDPDAIFTGAVLWLREPAESPRTVGAASALTNPAARMALSPMSVSSMPSQSSANVLSPFSSSPVPVQSIRPPDAPLSASLPPASRAISPLGPSSAPQAALAVPESAGAASLTQLALTPTVQIALQYNGTPYVYGGDSPMGFDCSGFVYFVLNRIGKPVPRDLLGQYQAGAHPVGPLQPGDIVFFRDTYEPGLSHNGIYVGDGKFIHAIDESRGVGISNLNDSYFQDRWYGATRVR